MKTSNREPSVLLISVDVMKPEFVFEQERPGALFWMWVAAILGMATKFAEITLGVRYHSRDEAGEINGEPMYYISRAFRAPWMGAVVAVLLFIQNAGATLIQSNTIGLTPRAWPVRWQMPLQQLYSGN